MSKINMNSLPNPNEKPANGTIIPKGMYLAKIVKAEMKTPKSGKADYFSAECNITDPTSGAQMGKFWINLYESEAALVRYQLSRFIYATNLNIVGDFELKDLTKMVIGRELMVDICPEERKDGTAPQRSVVDVSAECFYPTNMMPAEEDPSEVFMNAVSTPAVESAPVQASY